MVRFKAIVCSAIWGLWTLTAHAEEAETSATPHVSSRTLLQTMIREHGVSTPTRAIVQPPSVTPAPFFKNHAVVFFYASTCPYCLQEAPIVKHWAAEQGVRIEARSIDDKTLPEFEDARPATKALVEAAYQGQPIRYPALFVLNELTHVLYPVAIGGLSEAELNTRMETLIPKIIQFESGAST